MRLEDLYTNILSLSERECSATLMTYTNNRNNQLAAYIPAPEKKAKSTKKTSSGTIAVTPEQLEVLRKLKLI